VTLVDCDCPVTSTLKSMQMSL